MSSRLCERHLTEYPLKEGEVIVALKVRPERCDACKKEAQL